MTGITGSQGPEEGMLSPYRVLDLTDEKGLLCGKLLGDLGADVIKVERPGGDPARYICPFYHDEVDPNKSLFWWTLNTSKRGITLDIESPEGKETFEKLVKTADFVLESFPPGYLDRLGLGYEDLEGLNPRIILVSITPFGQTGPYKDYKSPDIVAWGMGGEMYPCGDADRPPVRISHHSQAYLHASAEAAAGAMVALHQRSATGRGQRVGVSIQECVVRVTYLPTSGWDMLKTVHRRAGGLMPNSRIRRVWPCKDGHVIWMYWAGLLASWNLPFFEWLSSEGMPVEFLKSIDWATLDMALMSQDDITRIEKLTCAFFVTRTKAELLEGALRHRVMLYPISTAKDMVESVQLESREFWTGTEHPELGESILYPGAFTRTTEAPPRILRRAPLIGEHNSEILGPLMTNNRDEPAGADRLTSPQDGPYLPLKDVRIVEFAWNITGPQATRTLTAYGAEVIKIENKTHPDPYRTGGAFKDGIGGLNRTGNFNQDNAGKLSVSLNLAQPKGVELAKKFVARADIVVENFAGGVMERMGLGYSKLREVKPDIIMLSTCMQGQTGPYASHPGLGWHLTALSGFFQINGWPDREPMAPDGPYTDYIAPHFNVLAIMAAMDYRRRTGKGMYIDMSQYENGIQFLSPLVLDYIVNKRVATRMGNRSNFAAPHGAFRCKGDDRWCAIAVMNEDEWTAFCKVTGHPAWTADTKFGTLERRKGNEDELEKLVEAWTVGHSAEDVMDMMQRAGVGAGVLETGQDLLEGDPHLRCRRFFEEVDHPEIGKYRVPRPCFLLSKSSYDMRRSPLLGEHSEYCFKEILGISEEEIAELVMEGVIE